MLDLEHEQESRKDQKEKQTVYTSETLQRIVLPAEDGICFLFGRRNSADPQTSRSHFQIIRQKGNLFLTDCGSRNGTYLKGNRMEAEQPTLLEKGDWIFASGISFFCFDRILFVTRVLKDIKTENPIRSDVRSSEPLLFRKTDENILDRLIHPMQYEPVEVEAPVPLPGVEKPSWFSAIGSSALIMISSLSGLSAMALRNPEDQNAILVSLVSSSCMAAAFFVYGMISRSLNIRKDRDRQRRICSEYSAYLNECCRISEQRMEKIQSEEQSVNLLIETLDECLLKAGSRSEKWILPYSREFGQIPSFELPRARYSQKEEKTWQELEDLKDLRVHPQIYRVLESGTFSCLPVLNENQKRGLYGAWLWMNSSESLRWIWISRKSQRNTDRFSWHPCGWIENTRLVFESLAGLEKSGIPELSGFSFTVYIEKETESEEAALRFHERYPEMTVLCEDGQKTRFSSGDLLPEIWSSVNDEKIRKSIVYPCTSENRNGWDEALYNRDSLLSDFRSPGTDLKVRLSEQVVWDLEEDGPHALIAGTTGSGKSEGLMSVLFQLILKNSSRNLQLILIDFKGSALASPFRNCPHTAGIVTNLEKNAFSRLEKALNRELELRQKKIREWLDLSPWSAGDLASYNAANPEEPISHLIIAVDEFAQLKQKFPEAMKMLQETARIGRSLGIHLILATQKPAGVVDEQIWSNAKSRICFKVSTVQDSREMLGHEKAAALKLPGEFILKIAQDEEKSGRALYSRASCFGTSSFSVLEMDGKPAEEQLKREAGKESLNLTIQERIMNLISKEDSRRKDWILCPDFSEAEFFRTAGLIDCIRTMETFDLCSIKSCLISAEAERTEETMQILCRSSRLPVFAVPADHKEWPEDIMLKADQLWNLFEIQSETLLVIEYTPSIRFALISRLLNNPNLHVVLVCQNQKLSPEFENNVSRFEMILASGNPDRELLYSLFLKTGLEVPDWPEFYGFHRIARQEIRMCLNSEILKTEKKIPSVCCGSSEPSSLYLHNPVSWKNRKHPALYRLIGFEADQGLHSPVYLEEDPILICARTRRGRKEAEKLIRMWMEQDTLLDWGYFPEEHRISVALLPEHQEALMDESNEQEIYSRKILYIGEGISSASYLLKCHTPLECNGDGILFDEGDSTGIDLLKLQDEN